MSKDYDDNENDDIFRKEQIEKFYAESKPLREKYKPRELSDEEIAKDTHCKYCKQGCYRCDARKTLTDEEIKKIAIECGAYENEDNGGLITDDICIGSFAETLLKASRGEK